MSHQAKRRLGMGLSAASLVLIGSQVPSSHPWQFGIVLGVVCAVAGWLLVTDNPARQRRGQDRQWHN